MTDRARKLIEDEMTEDERFAFVRTPARPRSDVMMDAAERVIERLMIQSDEWQRRAREAEVCVQSLSERIVELERTIQDAAASLANYQLREVDGRGENERLRVRVRELETTVYGVHEERHALERSVRELEQMVVEKECLRASIALDALERRQECDALRERIIEAENCADYTTRERDVLRKRVRELEKDSCDTCPHPTRVQELESALSLSQSLRNTPLVDPAERDRDRLDRGVFVLMGIHDSDGAQSYDVKHAVESAALTLAAIDAHVEQRYAKEE